MNELNVKPIEILAPLIQRKEVSPVELVNSVLSQIEQYNSVLNAYISIYKDNALNAAKEAEKQIMNGNYIGPFHGIPIGIKDNLYIKNEITTMGSSIHRNFKPEFNATVVDKLYDTGAVIMGKQNMHEYALGITNNNPHYGASKNPWNVSKISGGSSGGSSVSVSAHMATASLGTDTGGSIRIPSAACGVVGLKPTFGRVSKYGCFPEAWSLDHIGPITKTVNDARLMLGVLEGFDKKDPTSIKIPKNVNEKKNNKSSDIIIGINESFYFNKVDREIERKIKERIQQLESSGFKVQEVEIPTLQYVEYALTITDMCEASTVHHHNLKTRIHEFGEDTRQILELGEVPSAVEYLQAQQIRRKLKLEFEEVFNEVDVMITPTMPIMVPNIGEEEALLNGKNVDLFDHALRLTSPSNFIGLPSMTVPCDLINNMPVGMQIIGDLFNDHLVIEIGEIIEKMNSKEVETPNLSRIIP